MWERRESTGHNKTYKCEAGVKILSWLILALLLGSCITTVQLVPVHSEVLRPAALSSYHVINVFFSNCCFLCVFSSHGPVFSPSMPPVCPSAPWNFCRTQRRWAEWHLLGSLWIKKKKADSSQVQRAKNRRLWVRLAGTYGWVAWKITGSEDLCRPSSSKSFSFLSNAGRTSESGKTDKLRQGLQQGACISFKYLIKIHDSMIIGVAGQLSHNNIHHSCVTWCHWPTVAPIKNNNTANRIFSALNQDLFFICLTFI